MLLNNIESDQPTQSNKCSFGEFGNRQRLLVAVLVVYSAEAYLGNAERIQT